MSVSTPLPFCSPSGAPAVAKLALTIRICPCTFGSERRPLESMSNCSSPRAGDIGTDQLRQAKIDACPAPAWMPAHPSPRHIGLECHLGAGAANGRTLQVQHSVRIIGANRGFSRQLNAVLVVHRQLRDHQVRLQPGLVLQRTAQSRMELRSARSHFQPAKERIAPPMERAELTACQGLTSAK